MYSKDVPISEVTGDRKTRSKRNSNYSRKSNQEPIAPLNNEALKVVAERLTDSISPVVLMGLLKAIDFLLLMVLGISIYFILVLPENPPSSTIYIMAFIAVPAMAFFAFQTIDLYNIFNFKKSVKQAAKISVAWVCVFSLSMVVYRSFNVTDWLAIRWLTAWFVVGLISLLLIRAFYGILLSYWKSQGKLERRTVIIGGGKPAEELIKALEASPDSDLKICGVFDDRADERSPENTAGYPKLGDISQLVEFCRLTRVDLMIVSLPISAEDRLLQVLKKIWILPVDIRLSALSNKLRLRPRSYSYIGNVPFLDVFDRPIRDWDTIVKAVFDKIFGSLVLLATLPIMGLVALAIRLESDGPIFFKQKRFGFNNELIEIYKFRSMYVDQTDNDATKLVTKDDPRVTKVGKFIRKTSLDELPQLLNVVFKGDLSLIGPRPHALKAKAAEILYEEVVDGYFARHRVKPGISGWAQINGWRGETDTKEKLQQRVEHDLYYIENWSVFLDIKILILTPFSLLSKSDNAF